MDTLRDRWVPYSQRAARPLNVIIVGAGIGGLTAGISLSQTGHSVTILERVNKIDEVGAGIQLAPNASRILNRLGVLEEIMEHATVLERVSIRRYSGDDELSTVPLMPAQGAANAIEDAAVLATALTCTADVKLALKMYEVIRKDRGEQIAASAAKTAHTLHLPDGPEQRDRDEAIVSGTQNPDRWSNGQWQDYMYGVDVMKATVDLWNVMQERTVVRSRQVNL
ncbi:unnamed protein product [Fusarium langsethiae]|nr:unnamed protein product [Fusarium langsethiae]